MKVLLLHDVDRLGKQGEVVDVRDGYARNFLFPKNLAVKPTPKAHKTLELIKRKQAKLEQKLISEAQQVARALEAIPEIVIEVRATATGNLYGSVTPSMVVDALRDHKIKVDAKQIEMPSGIKQIGEYQVKVTLYKNLASTLKLRVVPTAEVAVGDKSAEAAKVAEKEPSKTDEKKAEGEAPLNPGA